MLWEKKKNVTESLDKHVNSTDNATIRHFGMEENGGEWKTVKVDVNQIVEGYLDYGFTRVRCISLYDVDGLRRDDGLRRGLRRILCWRGW